MGRNWSCVCGISPPLFGVCELTILGCFSINFCKEKQQENAASFRAIIRTGLALPQRVTSRPVCIFHLLAHSVTLDKAVSTSFLIHVMEITINTANALILWVLYLWAYQLWIENIHKKLRTFSICTYFSPCHSLNNIV